MIEDKPSLIHLDEAGVMRVGNAGVSLDDIAASHLKGHSTKAILARFPSLTPQELQAALEYHAASWSDAIPSGPEHRDAQWQRWNATAEEDNGTDTPPNMPIGENQPVPLDVTRAARAARP